MTSTQSKAAKYTVAEFIAQQIAISPKSQREIAADIGYGNPNVITMIKQGSTKLPINKVGLLAKSLGLDPRYLLRIVMQEYAEETWKVLQELLEPTATVSEEELQVIGVLRQAAKGVMPRMDVEQNREALLRVAQECTERDWAQNNATIARQNLLPANMRKKA